MRGFVLPIIIIFFQASELSAQHSTLNFSDSPINLNQQSLLIVPFNSRMYLSDINTELGRENNLTSDEIIERFIAGVDQSIYYTFRERCDISSFYLLEDESIEQDLNYIYSNLKLEYELVASTEEKSKIEQFKNRFKKKNDEKYKKGSINNGEIVSTRDNRERYMKAVVKDNKMIDSMHYKFDNKFFLFITQLEIRNNYTDAISMEQMQFNREIKLHYTLYHKSGEILSTGISRTSFPSQLNDINSIISKYFPILAKNIYNDLFEIEDETASKSKSKLKIWK